MVTKPYTEVKRLHADHKKKATLISFLMIPLSGLVTDIYAPSLPTMASELQQSEGAVQLTLTLFLLSYAVVQFFAGSIMDSYGRYRITLISLVLFILSNVVIAMSTSLGPIYAMRILQGIAIGCIGVAKRSFFVDVHEGDKRKHYLSIMSIVWSIAPIVAPFIGGYLQHYFNWQASFYVLAGYASVLFFLELLYSGETVPEFRPFKRKAILKDYGTMLRTPMFLYGVICSGLCYGTIMIFNLSGAFIVEHGMGFPPVVAGYASLIMGIAWLLGGFIGKSLIDRPFVPKLRIANILGIAVTILMILSATVWENLYSLILFAFLVHVGVGFIFNNYFAYCIGRFPKMAGISGGFIGGSAFFITSISSYAIVGLVHPQDQSGLGISYLAMAMLIMVILLFLVRPEKA
ncbi:Multidrug resistance protein [Flagellimonas taeanensis]|uniref:Multidrug resistance protein n=1 Tax=Flagellimonas taeanensis TaxID=1005926 RepID=A0A1M6WX66_9FLAO|nr:MFS transporter [Allomuricauda taeanensis]SFB99725.1 Multidrug resistance protein [Allomuricauda taeanensis]SHK98159.1 Multidrug resistance protein [Allomuricauda taeanensis]